MSGTQRRAHVPGARFRAPARPLVWASVVGAAAAAALLATDHSRAAGLLALAGGIAVALPPRAPAGAWQVFVRSVAERLADAAMLSVLAWESRNGPPRVAALALSVLALSFLFAYVKARGDSLGLAAPAVASERAALLGLVGIGLLHARLLEPALWSAGVVEVALLARRWVGVWRQPDPGETT